MIRATTAAPMTTNKSVFDFGCASGAGTGTGSGFAIGCDIMGARMGGRALCGGDAACDAGCGHGWATGSCPAL